MSTLNLDLNNNNKKETKNDNSILKINKFNFKLKIKRDGDRRHSLRII